MKNMNENNIRTHKHSCRYQNRITNANCQPTKIPSALLPYRRLEQLTDRSYEEPWIYI